MLLEKKIKKITESLFPYEKENGRKGPVVKAIENTTTVITQTTNPKGFFLYCRNASQCLFREIHF